MLVGVVAWWRGGATYDLLEALPELGRHVVVDDRVGARIAVRHAPAQDPDHLVRLAGRRHTVVRQQCVDVVRQPRQTEHDDDEQYDARRVRRTRVRVRMRGERRPFGALQEADDEPVQHADEHERQRIGEREERDEHRANGVRPDAAVRVSVDGIDAMGEQRGHVHTQHDNPDQHDQDDHVPSRAVRLACVVAARGSRTVRRKKKERRKKERRKKEERKEE